MSQNAVDSDMDLLDMLT